MILLAAADAIQRMDRTRGEAYESQWDDAGEKASGQWDAEEQRTFEAVCSLLTHGFQR
jgi:hypothetical protein